MYYDLLKTRRSMRKFSNQEIDPEIIDEIVRCALLSPSSRSIRPWEFIVVKDPAMLEKLSRCRKHSSQLLAGAKLAIVVIADAVKSDVWIEDCSIASITIQMAAHSLGLGSCWVQVRKRPHDEKSSAVDYIRQLLEIPGQYEVESIIAIGYPVESKSPYEKHDLRMEKVHAECYR